MARGVSTKRTGDAHGEPNKPRLGTITPDDVADLSEQGKVIMAMQVAKLHDKKTLHYLLRCFLEDLRRGTR